MRRWQLSRVRSNALARPRSSNSVALVEAGVKAEARVMRGVDYALLIGQGVHLRVGGDICNGCYPPAYVFRPHFLEGNRDYVGRIPIRVVEPTLEKDRKHRSVVCNTWGSRMPEGVDEEKVGKGSRERPIS